ncbi:hypothetical protein PAMP_018862 [Pampus punctatissimus]
MSFPDLQRATETHPPPERASQKDRGRETEREKNGGRKEKEGKKMRGTVLIKGRERQGEMFLKEDEVEKEDTRMTEGERRQIEILFRFNMPALAWDVK